MRPQQAKNKAIARMKQFPPCVPLTRESSIYNRRATSANSTSDNYQSEASAFTFACAAVFAPAMIDATAGRDASQEIASSSNECRRDVANFARASVLARFSSVNIFGPHPSPPLL